MRRELVYPEGNIRNAADITMSYQMVTELQLERYHEKNRIKGKMYLLR